MCFLRAYRVEIADLTKQSLLHRPTKNLTCHCLEQSGTKGLFCELCQTPTEHHIQATMYLTPGYFSPLTFMQCSECRRYRIFLEGEEIRIARSPPHLRWSDLYLFSDYGHGSFDNSCGVNSERPLAMLVVGYRVLGFPFLQASWLSFCMECQELHWQTRSGPHITWWRHQGHRRMVGSFLEKVNYFSGGWI